MFSFIRIDMVNKNLKIEVGTRNWGIAMIGWTKCLFGEIGTLGLWVRKAVECFKHCLMGHTSRSMEYNGFDSDLNCGN